MPIKLTSTMSSPYDLTALSSPAEEDRAVESDSHGPRNVIKQEPGLVTNMSSPNDLTALSSPIGENCDVESTSDVLPFPIKQDPGLQRVKAESFDVASPWSRSLVVETPESDNEVNIDIATSASLEKLVTENTPERLEAAVQEGVRLLDQIKTVLDVKTEEAREQGDSAHWLKQIESVRTEARPSRTIVGVVGNTGAGKSSVINAVLEEERLVPTNCMRACTAVVTEMSYNNSDDEECRYKAEIEFIKPEDWAKELKVLFDEILDSNGTGFARDVTDEDSDAAIAYAKIRAVYNRHTKEALLNSSIEELMREPHVRTLLGSTKTLKHRDPSSFYKRLQFFVDSKEKPMSKDGTTINPFAEREFEYWPLIKVVRIYTKADALSTGAVLVDLPGVHDSNAARAAVAEGYMKQSTGLWIVAPINRAVDDKAAKNLLGETFRRQLKFDGTYSAVTFICSKTDDISITEAIDSLGLSQQMSGLDDELMAIEQDRKQFKRQMNEVKDKKSDLRDAIEDADDQMEKWETLRDQVEAGKTVYAPRDSRKRKRSQEVDEDDLAPSDHRGQPLTEDIVEKEIDTIRKMKKEARRQRVELDEQLEKVTAQYNSFDGRIEAIEAKKCDMCIAGRNKYSKGAFQQDFAAGIKELDQENLAEEDEDNFDPEDDLRDYEAVARSLPVFCVSSRAYQKLSGRMVKDNDVPGFSSKEQTEIPQLQAHCKKLTEANRAASCRRFLNSLIQLCNSLVVWSQNDGTGILLSNKQKRQELEFVQKKLRGLEDALEKSIADTLEELRETLKENIFDEFDKAIQSASEVAVTSATKWGANRNEGGLLWATYNHMPPTWHLLRSCWGPRDFNAELTELIYKQLGRGWEKAFQRRSPLILRQSVPNFKKLLLTFHESHVAREHNSGNPRLPMLIRQVESYAAVFQDLANGMTTLVNNQQKDCNRGFTPAIQEVMTRAYDLCVAEAGPGSFKRMKGHMTAHVDAQKHAMFKAATEVVQEQLEDMTDLVAEQMEEKVDAVFVAMRRDYLTVLGHVENVDRLAPKPKWERQMRREVGAVITKSEGGFEQVLTGSVVQEPNLTDDDSVLGDATVIKEDPGGDIEMRMD